MNILRIIDSMDPRRGGPVQMVNSTSAIHKTMGHETTVLSVDAPDAQWHQNPCYKVVALGPGKWGWSFSSRLKPWLEANIRDYDLVIIHGLWQYHSYAAGMIAKTLHQTAGENRPIFLLFTHGMLDPWFQSWSRRPIKTLRNIIYWHGFEKRVVRSVDALLFTSEQEKILAQRTFSGYQSKSDIVVPYGCENPPEAATLDSTAIARKCKNLRDKPYWLFMGRIHPKKGVDLLIRAYVALLDSHPANTEIPDLLISGPGLETPFGQSLLPLIKNHQDRIHFPGMLKGNDKWSAYYGSEAFFLPSHQENFGIVVAEALACGKRVYISDQINIYKEILEEQVGEVAPDTLEGVKELFSKAHDFFDNGNKESQEALSIQCFRKRFSIRETAMRLPELHELIKKDSKCVE